MSEQIKDGGPAFPCTDENSSMHGGFGMTLRDYFAAKAMQGWLASGPTIGGRLVGNTDESADKIASASYLFANAMLAARESKP